MHVNGLIKSFRAVLKDGETMVLFYVPTSRLSNRKEEHKTVWHPTLPWFPASVTVSHKMNLVFEIAVCLLGPRPYTKPFDLLYKDL